MQKALGFHAQKWDGEQNTSQGAGRQKELMMSVMLEEAHKAFAAMSVAANPIKDEEWGEAEGVLITVQEFVARLLRVVGDKTQEEILAPKPEKGDRG